MLRKCQCTLPASFISMNGCIAKICHLGEYRVPRGRAEKPVRSSEASRSRVPHPPPPPRRPRVPLSLPGIPPTSPYFSTPRFIRRRGTCPQAHQAKRHENCIGNGHRIGRGGGFRVRERAQHTILLLTTTSLRCGERRGRSASNEAVEVGQTLPHLPVISALRRSLRARARTVLNVS